MSRVVLYDSMGKVKLSLELKVGAEQELFRLLSGSFAPLGSASGSGAGDESGVETLSESESESECGSESGSATATTAPTGKGTRTGTGNFPVKYPSNIPAEASPPFQSEEHLVHLDRARAFIFRGASHEIRGALNIQSLLVDLLQTRLQRLGVPKKELEPSCVKIAAQVPRIVQKLDFLANLNPDGKALSSSAELRLEDLLQSIWAFAQKMAQPRGVDVGLQIASELAGPAPSSRLADALILLFSALIEAVQDVELTVSLQAASPEAPLLMHRSWARSGTGAEEEDSAGGGREPSSFPADERANSELRAKSSREGVLSGTGESAGEGVLSLFELQIVGAPFTRDSRLEVALRAFERLGSRWNLDDKGLVFWL